MKIGLSAIFCFLSVIRSPFLGACAACGIGLDDKSRVAFILTTALLTLTPLFLGGGFIYYLYFLHKKKEALYAEKYTN